MKRENIKKFTLLIRASKLKCKSIQLLRNCTLTLFISFLAIDFSFADYAAQTFPDAIQFNYSSTNNNDAITIKNADGTSAVVPEWIYYERSNSIAYIAGNSNIYIKVRFAASCPNTNLLINLTVQSPGVGIGQLVNYTISNYTPLSWVTIQLNGTIPSTIGKRSFTWRWDITTTPNVPGYFATSTFRNTSHIYYTVLASPVAPESTPRINILDYACTWANNKSTANEICNAFLTNGFYQHYTWDENCYRLSSNFVRLASSLGITAAQHRWANYNGYREKGYYDIDHMIRQHASLDPVGNKYGNGPYIFDYHQWAEASETQFDPTANKYLTGSWGGYEDYSFSGYDRADTPQSYTLDINYPGQQLGCEAPGNRNYWYNPVVQDWLEPDR
jgi:hypothetical protein